LSSLPSFTFRSPLQVIFGTGTLKSLPSVAAKLGSRALVVTGGGSLRRSGRLDGILAALADKGLSATVFEGVEPDPSIQTIDRGRAAFRADGCDLVIAIGGGSTLDAGKAIGALARADEPTAVYFAGQEITSPGAPIVALPTTSGTGAEVTPNSVLSDRQSHVKQSIRGEGLMPLVAIVDPELTLGLPPEQTAYTGLDALTQALESYVSKGANPVSDHLAEESIVRIAGSLYTAYADGDNLQAREDMALGSLLAGLALASARLGLVHGLVHPLGEAYHITHGLACAITLPHVMEYNIPAAAAKYARAARLIGISEPTDEAHARTLIAWFRELASKTGAGAKLGDVGAREEDFAGMVPAILASGSTKHNPREATAEDVLAIMRAAL
jgi:alcohol dehydrogenase class IV